MSSLLSSSTIQHEQLKRAIELSLRHYFQRCRRRVPGFVARHYRYPGCWSLNRRAFGWDLLRAPANLLWAPVYVCLVLLFYAAAAAGWNKARYWARALPGGLTTAVQRQADTVLRTELLRGADELGQVQREIALQLLGPDRSLPTEVNTQIEHALKQIMLARTAAADIGNTVLSTTLGALLYKKFTPGGVGLGLLAAALWAESRATQEFPLGATLGRLYYRIYDAHATVLEQVTAVGLTLALMAVLTSFAGLLIDPLQALLGLHQRRLRRMLLALERDTLAQIDSRFRPLDPYLARIFELVDTLKAPLNF